MFDDYGVYFTENIRGCALTVVVKSRLILEVLLSTAVCDAIMYGGKKAFSGK